MPFANGVSVSDMQQVAEDAVTANADPLPKHQSLQDGEESIAVQLGVCCIKQVVQSLQGKARLAEVGGEASLWSGKVMPSLRVSKTFLTLSCVMLLFT